MKINLNPAMPQTNNIAKSQNKRNNSISFQRGFETKAAAKHLNIGKYIALGLGGVLLTISGANSFKIVDPGERGIKVRLGKVLPEVYEEGLHFKWPFIESIETANIKTKKMQLQTNVYTKDIQQATVDYAINYNLQPQKVNKLYQEIGLRDYEDKIITPIVLGAIKDIVGKWNAQDLIGNREKAATDILEKLQKQLQNNYVTVTNFEITAKVYDPNNPEETIKIDGNIYEPSFNQEEEHMIMPGVSFDKDPYVGIGKGSEDAAVYVYVENNFSNKVNFSINSGWEVVIATEGSISDTYTSGLFKYTAGLQSSSDSDVWTTTPLFSTLNVADDATGVDFTLDEEENPEIKVSAFLHQVSADGELISEDVIENAAKEAFGIN